MSVQVQQSSSALPLSLVVGRSPCRLLEGPGVEAFAATWVGSILWVARSPLRPHRKRKNWFVGVFKLEPRAIMPAELDPTDVRHEASSVGGPGGQHQNKTSSAVWAVPKVTGLAVVARGG